MFLYLAQHGEAKREQDDPARGLTDKGLLDVGKVAGHLAEVVDMPLRIYHSGKTRAMQTASLFYYSLKPTEEIIGVEGLSPMDDPGIWGNRLWGIEQNVMLVGHLPHLARLSGQLLVGDPRKTVINFKMGGVVCLKRDEPGRWLLEWMVTPDVIR